MFTVSSAEDTVTFSRSLITGRIEVDTKIEFLKLIQNALSCEVLDAKTIVDNFIHALDSAEMSHDFLRTKIDDELSYISETADLISILRFVRSSKTIQSN